MSHSEENTVPSTNSVVGDVSTLEEQSKEHSVQEEPPLAYSYPHATKHPPIAPVPGQEEHEVKSYGGAPEGGT